MFLSFSICYIHKIIFYSLHIMMNFLKLLMKRPSDSQIRIAKIVLGIMLIATGLVAFYVQNLELENTIFWITLDMQMKQIIAYSIIIFGAIPLILWGLDLNILSRGYTRIIQILFGITLIIISGIFIDQAVLTVDIFYFLLWVVVAFAWITGKFITKKWLKHGQKITKIRV